MRPGVPAILALCLLLAACTGTSVSVPSTTPAAEGAACPSGTTAQDGLCLSSDPVSEHLAAVLRSSFTEDQLGAVIAGVWHDGEPVLVGALGESMTDVPATPDMHHLLGNLATPMYATVVLQQVEAGALNLSDPVSTWFPELPASDQVTVEMLLHNTSGYSQFTGQPAFLEQLHADPFRHWEIADIVPYGVGDGPTFTPGADWGFSDTNTMILSLIVEEATGRPFAELLHEGVLDPLGMTNTTTDLNADWPQPVLHGYSSERGVWEDVTMWNPSWAGYAGGLGSNQDDLRVFLEALGSGELLPAELHEVQLAPTLAGIAFNTEEQYWGMGTLVLHDWVFMNPGLSGYFGAGGNLAEEGWTIVIYTTTSQTGDQAKPSATDIFFQFSAIVSPEHSLAP
jgi:D-alanyl-D-alanine carboxypeptidase